MTKKDKAIYEYGIAQINRLRDVLLSSEAVTAEEFESILSVVKEEQTADIIERGTLALEKEKANRPVDKFHYAKYRRAGVDIFGASLSYGLFMRLFNTAITEHYGETAKEQKDKLNLIMHEMTGLGLSREKDYQEEMKSDPEKILADLCGFIDCMTADNFYWITIGADTENNYAGAYTDIFDVIREGATALQNSKGGTEANAQTLHEHIKQAVIRLTGQEPPENDPPHIKFRHGFLSLNEGYAAVEGGSSGSPSENTDQGKSLYQIDGQQTLEEFGTANKAEEPSEILNVAGKRAYDFIFPLDKLNNNIWRLPEKVIKADFHVEKKGSTREALVLYTICFDDLKDISVSKALTPYDKRVCIAVGALLNAENEVMTLRQIYRAMGNSGAAGKTDLERIESSLIKMRGARITIDNGDEATKLKSRSSFIYEGSVLPYESVKVKINGKTIETAIKPLREPPLLSFAKARKQVIKLQLKAYESPLSKTEQTILLEDYIIDRIAKISSGKGQPKILYNTVFEKLEITDKKQKQRAKAKAKALLEYYKNIELIKDFNETDDGINISA